MTRNARAAGQVEPCVIVRDALPDEFATIGDLRLAAYRADGFLTATSGYAPILHALGADGAGEVLAAVDGGQVIGTVMLLRWPGGNITRSPEEAEIRALAVAPHTRGRGIGTALITTVIERAARHGVRQLMLLTHPEMRAAQRLYAGAGFGRMPERDWSPGAGEALLAYGLALAP